MGNPVTATPGFLGSAISKINASTEAQTLLAQNLYRGGVIIVNTDTNDLYIRYGAGAGAAAGNWTYKIMGGETWEMTNNRFLGRIEGVWSAAGSGYAEITELA